MAFDDPFIAWDGEGINDGFIDRWTQRQNLVLLSNSRGDSIYNAKGLSFVERLQWLRPLAEKYKKAIHVFFGGNYDFNKLLEGLTRQKVEKLHQYGWTTFRDRWLFRYRPRKELTIGWLRDDFDFSQPAANQIACQIRFWDTIGFFQAPFLSVLKEWLGKDYCDYEMIASGKSRRTEFTIADRAEMERYNAAENRAHVVVMDLLRDHLRRLGLRISRWDGAGAIAAAMFRQYGLTKSYYRGKVKIQLPAEVQTAAQYAYFGGRIESGQIGLYEGTIYNYDINSAYPSAATQLPNMNNGEWFHHMGPILEEELPLMDPMTIYRVQWRFHNDRHYYPFPYRCSDGSVLFPRRGERWIMGPEVLAAARSLQPGDQIFIWEAWEFKHDAGKQLDNSFGVIASIYRDRQDMVKRGDPAEKPLKLGLNALYGKLCQRLGYNKRTGKQPSFHFTVFAAMITSITRARIYDAIANHQDAIISICTDGIISTAPLSIRVAKEKELGAWSMDIADQILQLQSGVYWIRKGETLKERARGCGRVAGKGECEEEREHDRQDQIENRIAMIMKGMAEGKSHIYLPEVRVFVTSRKACISDEWFKRWGHWFIIHDEINEGRKLDISCGSTGKRRLESPVTGALTFTRAAENVEWNGRIGDSKRTDLGQPYALPWDGDPVVAIPPS